jgi:hypothetical protein
VRREPFLTISNSASVKYWEIIADNLRKRGWSLGWVSALDREGQTIWIVDAHGDNGKRFVLRDDEKLTAFMELFRTRARENNAFFLAASRARRRSLRNPCRLGAALLPRKPRKQGSGKYNGIP